MSDVDLVFQGEFRIEEQVCMHAIPVSMAKIHRYRQVEPVERRTCASPALLQMSSHEEMYPPEDRPLSRWVDVVRLKWYSTVSSKRERICMGCDFRWLNLVHTLLRLLSVP